MENFTSIMAEAQNKTQFFSMIIALTLNILLIFLILNFSPKELGPYKYLMIYISTFEIIYALLDVIVSPIAHSHGTTFMVIVNLKKTSISPNILSVLLSAYCGFYGSSMAIFGIHFIYRYLVASGSKLLGSFRSRKIMVWFLIPILIGILWTVLTYWPCMRREATDRYVEHAVLEKFGLTIHEIEYIAPYFYELDKNGKEQIFWPSFIGIGINSCIINTSIFIIIYFGVKCYRCLKDLVPDERVSIRNRSLQKQLFIALVFQTLIPVVLMHIPVSTLYFCSFLSVDLGSASGIAPLTIALYPVLDPLPTMFMIRGYRETIYDAVMWIPRKCSRSSPTPQGQSRSGVSNTEL